MTESEEYYSHFSELLKRRDLARARREPNAGPLWVVSLSVQIIISFGVWWVLTAASEATCPLQLSFRFLLFSQYFHVFTFPVTQTRIAE